MKIQLKLKKYAGLRHALLSVLLLAGPSAVHAADDGKGGVRLSGTRLIFDGAHEAAPMTVSNSSASDVWLMRFWVSPYGEKATQAADEKQKEPFVVTPPLYRLDPRGAVELRINRLTDALPADRESVYYLNNLAIPPKKGEKTYQKAVQNGLQFAINTRIKLFYRPAAISNAAAAKAAPEKLAVSASGNTMVIKNPTPYFITLSQLSLSGKTITTNKDTMVAPFGELTLPSGASHGTLIYSTIDDHGMTTPALKKTF